MNLGRKPHEFGKETKEGRTQITLDKRLGMPKAEMSKGTLPIPQDRVGKFPGGLTSPLGHANGKKWKVKIS